MEASEIEYPEYDFEWTIEDSGRIYNKYDGGQYVIPDGNSLRITPVGGAATSWMIVREVPAEVPAEEEEDVPVSRASALIEEALNARATCGCECGCGPDCQGCECECGCPKAAPEEVSK